MFVLARSEMVVKKSASPQTAEKVFVTLSLCLWSNFSYGVASEGQKEMRATLFL